MSRNLAMLLMFVSVVAADVRSAQAQRPPGARENFTVVASGETVILVDQREGRTWLLAHSPTGGTPAWVPIQRFENPEEAEHWREEQRHFAEEREREHREQQEREIRERLEDRRRETMQRREEFEERFRRERERDARERDDRERDDDDRDDDDREWEEREPQERQERERPGGAEAPAPDGSGVREHLQRLGQETQRAMMKSLEEHRRRMVEQFGKDHPAVRSIGEQIERLGRKLGEAPEAAEPPAKKHDDTKSDAGTPEPQKPPLKKKADPDAGDAKAQTFAAALRKAYPLLQEELKTLEDTGADEARVKEVRKKIEILERLLKQIDEKERRAGSVPKKKQASERDKEAGTDKKAKSDAKAGAEASEKESNSPPEAADTPRGEDKGDNEFEPDAAASAEDR